MIQNSARILFTARLAFQLVTLTAAVVAVSAGSAESDLIRQLLQDYNPAARPVLNPGDAINVTVSLGLKTFIELNMRSQTAVSFGWLKIVWKDALLTWDPADHGNTTALYLPVEKVWCPELVIFNTLADINALNEQPTKVAVSHDGQILWYPGGLFQTYCTVDITYYPFDTQLCSIDIITWSLPVQFLNGSFADPVFDLIDILENHPAWNLMKTDSEFVLRRTGYWILKFKLVIKRKTLFYILNIILPMTLLSSLSSLVFVLPAQSGEKMTVCVTSFLSLAVFVSFINETLPQNSDSLCFFSVYVMVQMLLSLCSTAVCAFTVSLVHRERRGKAASNSHNHTEPNVDSSRQTRKSAAAVNITSLSSHSDFSLSLQASYNNYREALSGLDVRRSIPHRPTTQPINEKNSVDNLVSDLATTPSSCREYCGNLQRQDGRIWRDCSLCHFTRLDQKGSVKRQMAPIGTPSSDKEREDSHAPIQDKNIGTRYTFLERLALRVDKVFAVIMLSANLASCLVYTLSMMWLS